MWKIINSQSLETSVLITVKSLNNNNTHIVAQVQGNDVKGKCIWGVVVH